MAPFIAHVYVALTIFVDVVENMGGVVMSSNHSDGTFFTCSIILYHGEIFLAFD